MENTHFYKNIKILYEDSCILVCIKPAGVPVQTKSIGTQDMESLLKSYLSLSEKAKAPYLGIIHRLDQPVEGLLVFAKTPEAAAALNRQMASQGFEKHYLAVTCKRPSPDKGTLSCYLLKDGRTNTSRVCPKDATGAKYAELSYEVLEEQIAEPEKAADTPPLSLVRIQLKTGRHHQIRVQFAHAGAPLLGDAKYNPAAKSPQAQLPAALCAYRLCFTHPQSHKRLEFTCTPTTSGFQRFTF